MVYAGNFSLSEFFKKSGVPVFDIFSFLLRRMRVVILLGTQEAVLPFRRDYMIVGGRDSHHIALLPHGVSWWDIPCLRASRIVDIPLRVRSYNRHGMF